VKPWTDPPKGRSTGAIRRLKTPNRNDLDFCRSRMKKSKVKIRTEKGQTGTGAAAASSNGSEWV
jgi:hypothetical protein